MRRTPLAFVVTLVLCSSAPVALGDDTSRNVITNCGFEIDVSATPQRVITMKSTATEMLLALGLKDRIVGHAFQDGAPDEAWAEDYASVPVLSNRLPSIEAVLSLAPDLVYSGWESTFSANGIGTRAQLNEFGVRSYVSPAACRSPSWRPGKLHFDDVFAQVLEVGRIFGVSTKAEKIVTEQRQLLAQLPTVAHGLTAAWYSSGTDVPYMGAGLGAPQMMMEVLGLRNIAGEVKDSWTSMSWEAVVDADPDVLVLVDAAWNRAETKIERLETSPALARMKAIRNRNYITIPFSASEAGIRNAPAVMDMARQLKAQGF